MICLQQTLTCPTIPLYLLTRFFLGLSPRILETIWRFKNKITLKASIFKLMRKKSKLRTITLIFTQMRKLKKKFLLMKRRRKNRFLSLLYQWRNYLKSSTTISLKCLSMLLFTILSSHIKATCIVASTMKLQKSIFLGFSGSTKTFLWKIFTISPLFNLAKYS